LGRSGTDELARRFGANEVFLDKESLQAGRWREQIDAQLAACKVFIVVIGRHWLDAVDAQGNIRLQQADDVHRREVATALALPQVTVIPLLVDDAKLPGVDDLPDGLRKLTEQQARRLHDTKRTDRSIGIRSQSTLHARVDSATVVRPAAHCAAIASR